MVHSSFPMVPNARNQEESRWNVLPVPWGSINGSGLRNSHSTQGHNISNHSEHWGFDLGAIIHLVENLKVGTGISVAEICNLKTHLSGSPSLSGSKGTFLHPRWSSGHANISSVHITKSLDLGSSNQDKFLRWSYMWELFRLQFKKPTVTMPKAVTVSVGQHNMLNATSMTFSVCSYPVNHHLAHLPRPSPPTEIA